MLKPGGWFVCYQLPNRDSWIESRRRAHRPVPSRFRVWHGRKVPAAIANASMTCNAWDWLDAGLGRLLEPVCQNYLFTARKPLEPDGPAPT